MKSSVPGAAHLSRRTLLKTGLFGAGVVVVGSIGLQLRGTRARQVPDTGLACLSAEEFAVLTAVADRVCPAAGDGAPGALALGVPAKLDQWLAAYLDEENQTGVRIVLAALESALVGALFAERLTPFTQLAPEEQDEVLRAWKDSSVGFRRTAFRALSSMVAALYYGDSRTWSRIGYAGPPSVRGLRTAFAMNLVDLDALQVGAATEPAAGLPSLDLPTPDILVPQGAAPSEY